MTMPTVTKTWQYNVNQLIGGTGSSNDHSRMWCLAFKLALTGFASNGWTVVRSSDKVSVANSDLWGSDLSKLFVNISGYAHSWIVLHQPALGANFHICIDLTGTTATPIYVAVDGYDLSTGTVNDRPTIHSRNVVSEGGGAADRGYPNDTNQWALHVMMSSDGQCTRAFDTRASGAKCVFVMEKPNTTITEWVDPLVFGTFGHTGNAGDYPTYANLNDAVSLYGAFRSFRTWRGIYYTSMHHNSAAIGQRLTTANDITGRWPLTSVGIHAPTLPNGRVGTVHDMWWTSTGVATFDDWPGDGSKQFMTFGNIVVPWNGSTITTGAG